MKFPEDWLHIKNWEKFQYRSDKKLPWIRLDCGLLQDREFLKFDRATQRDLIAIWLLARNQSHPGWIPNDSKVVTRLIQGGRNLDLQVFVKAGFLEEKCALQDMTGQNKTVLAPAGAYVPTLTPEDIANGIKIINGKRFNPGVARQIN